MTIVCKEELGQVWTPDYIVESMLDEIGYTSDNVLIFTKKIMEPSFGTGVFLFEIMKRLIECSLSNNFSNDEIENIIENNVYAIEYDKDVYDFTVENLKNWLADEYSLFPKLKNFYNMDSLDFKVFDNFDFVVGNPPYIRVHDMPADMRKKVKMYSHSKGSADLYIIFFEIGLSMLNENGRLAYITPNSWLRNVSQKSFRKNVIDHGQLNKIVNFNSDKVFDNVGIYTCVSYMSKKGNVCLEYVDAKKDLQENYSREIKYSTIDLSKNDSLAFSSVSDQLVIDKHLLSDSDSLSNLCKVQNGVCTLGDKFFLIDNDDLGLDDYVYPVVKISKYKGDKAFQKIIFPYKKVSDRFVGIDENELSMSEDVYQYLLNNKDSLSSRSLDKGSNWFWYGRSQSIQEMGKAKLVFNPVIRHDQERIDAYIIPEGVIVYSGLMITVDEALDNEFSLLDFKNIVESEEFLKYCRIVGKDFSNNYKVVYSGMVKKFKP